MDVNAYTTRFKNWFNSQKTWVKLLLGLVIGVIFLSILPLAIGTYGAYKIYKSERITNKNTRIGLVGIVFVLTLLVQNAWGSNFSSDSVVDQSSIQPTPTVVPSEPTVQTTITPEQSELNAEFYDVTKVVDGDTLAIDLNGVNTTLRLIGIDTPETVDPRKPVQCYGVEASNKAKELLEGKKVRLEEDSSQGDKDTYDRLLRYVYLEDGTFFNELMISEGYAFEYTYDTPYKYQEQFKEAENYARTNKLGLWADNTCAGSVEPTPTNTPVPVQVQPTATPIPAAPTSKPTNPPQQSSCQYSCTSPDRDCSDFGTHAEAQAFFNCCGFTAENDPMRLDSVGVGDGIACESLP